MTPVMQILDPFATSSWAASRCPARQLTGSLHFMASNTAVAWANVETVYLPSDWGSRAVVAASWFFQYPGVKRWPVPLCPQPGTTIFTAEKKTNGPVPRPLRRRPPGFDT